MRFLSAKYKTENIRILEEKLQNFLICWTK